MKKKLIILSIVGLLTVSVGGVVMANQSDDESRGKVIDTIQSDFKPLVSGDNRTEEQKVADEIKKAEIAADNIAREEAKKAPKLDEEGETVEEQPVAPRLPHGGDNTPNGGSTLTQNTPPLDPEDIVPIIGTESN